jgi:hypothetical protein
MMGAAMKSIPDQVDLAFGYPDRFQMGAIEQPARFDAHLDQAGISLTLHRPGDSDRCRSVHLHLHYALCVDILRKLADLAPSLPRRDPVTRKAMREAAKELYLSLRDSEANDNGCFGEDGVRTSGRRKVDDMNMTPEEEVLLLHVLE